MSAFALITINYLNVDGVKKKAKAGSVFNDYDADEYKTWESKGWAREATVGEIAEAAARAPAEEKAEAKPAKERASRKPAKPKAEEDLA